MKTPESTSKDNGLKEKREFTLADNGPANVVEITEPTGIYESGYRGYYADKPDNDTREGLRGYVQAEYVSDDLTKRGSHRSRRPVASLRADHLVR